MVLEIATLIIKEGQNEKFESDFKKAEQYISSIEGHIEHGLQKCMEQENKYVFLVKWESLEAHTIGFRQSDVYQKWKSLLHHYYEPFPTVEHYQIVDLSV